MSTATIPATATKKDLGYKAFEAGEFRFSRDEYFAHVTYP